MAAGVCPSLLSGEPGRRHQSPPRGSRCWSKATLTGIGKYVQCEWKVGSGGC